jgi:hypothetical protein
VKGTEERELTNMIRRSIRLWVAALLVAGGVASCAPLTSSQGQQWQQWQYEEAKKNCIGCFGLYDSRCEEPQLSMYVGVDMTEICPRGR